MKFSKSIKCLLVTKLNPMCFFLVNWSGGGVFLCVGGQAAYSWYSLQKRELLTFRPGYWFKQEN